MCNANPCKKVAPVTKKELDAFKKRLDKDRENLLKTISPNMGPSPKTGDPEGGDVCDIASSDRERDLKLTLSERETANVGANAAGGYRRAQVP